MDARKDARDGVNVLKLNSLVQRYVNAVGIAAGTNFSTCVNIKALLIFYKCNFYLSKETLFTNKFCLNRSVLIKKIKELSRVEWSRE